jgi:hypothetical protein
MVRNNQTWSIEEGTELFSNEHDPALRDSRQEKTNRNIKYVFDNDMIKMKEKYFADPNKYRIKEFHVPAHLIVNKKPNETIRLHKEHRQLVFRIPNNYKNGDLIVVRGIF